MKTREIILRTLGAFLMALALVLIPLSQAEARTCPGLGPGEKLISCLGVCKTKKANGYKYIYRTERTFFRPTWAPQCRVSTTCGGTCVDRVRLPRR